MTEKASTFIAKSTIKAADLEHRRTINHNIGKYNAAVPAGKIRKPRGGRLALLLHPNRNVSS